MKTAKTDTISCKPFALFAALASLLLCSCASEATWQRKLVAEAREMDAMEPEMSDDMDPNAKGDEPEAGRRALKRTFAARSARKIAEREIEREEKENLDTTRDVFRTAVSIVQAARAQEKARPVATPMIVRRAPAALVQNMAPSKWQLKVNSAFKPPGTR